MNEESLWQDLAHYAETQAQELPSLPGEAELQAPIPLGDRLVELYLRGTIPMLLMTLAATVLIGYGNDGRTTTLGLLAAPLLVWLLTPFVRSQNGVSAARLVAIAVPLLILNVFLGLGSATLFHVWNGNPVHIEFLAWAFQGVLESTLRPPLLAYLGWALVVAILVRKAEVQYPWVDSSLWAQGHRLVGWTAVLVPLLVLAGSFTGLKVSKEQALWRAEVASAIAERPYAELPDDSPDRIWQERQSDVRARIRAQSGSEDYSSRLDRERALAGVPLFLDLHADPPSSQRELRAAINYLAGIEDGDLPAEDVQVYHTKAQLEAIPFNRSIGVSGLVEDFLLPALSKSQKTPDELEKLAGEIALARAEVQPHLETMDQIAYWLLWAEPHNLADRRVAEPGWKIGAAQISPSTFHRTIVYRGSPEPTPLQAFGKTFFWSPTRLVSVMERNRITREWLSLRERLATLEPSEREELLKARAKAERLGVGLRFWEELSFATSADRCAQLLETAELMARILETRGRSGQWPVDLETLVSKVQFAEAPEGRYRWDHENRALHDEVLGMFPIILVEPE